MIVDEQRIEKEKQWLGIHCCSKIDDVSVLSWFTEKKGTQFSFVVICRFKLFF